MEAVKKLVLNEQDMAEAVQLEALLEQGRARLNELKRKAKGVTCKVGTTNKGQVGFTIHGLGIPKWFYKQQALAIFGDNEEGKVLRQQVLDFIAATPELSDKE